MGDSASVPAKQTANMQTESQWSVKYSDCVVLYASDGGKVLVKVTYRCSARIYKRKRKLK